MCIKKEKLISNQNRRANNQGQISSGNQEMIIDYNNSNNNNLSVNNTTSFNIGINNNQNGNNSSDQSIPNNQIMQVFNFNI